MTKKQFIEKMAEELETEIDEMPEKHSEDDEKISEMLQELHSAECMTELLQSILEVEEKEKKEQASACFEGIKGFIEEKGWHTKMLDEKHRMISLGFSLLNTSLEVTIHVEAKAKAVSIITMLPIVCQKEYHMLMNSRLNQMNASLRYGAFHLDEENGEINYRFTYSINGQTFYAKAFEDYLHCCLMIPDTHYKKIAKLAVGSLSKDEMKEVLEQIKELAKAIND